MTRHWFESELGQNKSRTKTVKYRHQEKIFDLRNYNALAWKIWKEAHWRKTDTGQGKRKV
jgi:hypothetical protein